MRKISEEFGPSKNKVLAANIEMLRDLQKLDTFWDEIITLYTLNPEINENTAKDVLEDLENLE